MTAYMKKMTAYTKKTTAYNKKNSMYKILHAADNRQPFAEGKWPK